MPRLMQTLGFACCLLAMWPLHAQDLAATCHASSSYDVTVKPDSLLFDRSSPEPQRVELLRGVLRTDGVAVPLKAEDRDRLTLFERELRALVPRVRTVARNGVDMAVQAIRAEAGDMHLSASTRRQLEQRLNTDAEQLKQRIARSHSTHDWHGEIADQYARQLASDLVPLVAGDLGQQAINAALSGDLQRATMLRDRATELAAHLQPRLQQRMQALRPQIEALCPAIDRLAALQRGVRGSNGKPLDLLRIAQ